MRRYWIDAADKLDGIVRFRGDIHHHIFDVCRQEAGSKFEVLTEEGKAFLVEVLEVTRKDATARVLEERLIPPPPRPWIRVVLSIPRYPVMDSVLEKLVEMGAKSLHPVFSDFSFVRTTSTLSDNKVQRWEKIIRSATQQSGRGEQMELHPAQPLENLLQSINRNGAFPGLFAYEGPSTLGIKEALREIKRKNPSNLSEIWVFVGSEGGFSDQEVAMFHDLNLKSVTLGPQVLRVETACMALVSVLKYDLDLMR